MPADIGNFWNSFFMMDYRISYTAGSESETVQ